MRAVKFWQAPSLFQWWYSDRSAQAVGWGGLILAVALAFGAFDDGPLWLMMLVWLVLWVLYLSIVNVGQTFYSFGWKSLLLESGFLAIFLGTAHYAAPVAVLWLMRWVVFRLEFGAGLIKMRGDACWRNLTCLYYHYETQPMPNPVSWYIHWLPRWFHRLSVLGNHFVQLIVPFGLFLPQPYAAIAAVMIMLSQMWFAAMGPAWYEPWLFPFIEGLLANDRATLSLLEHNPFPDMPPRFIRAQLYLYHFTTPAERRQTGDWWKRTFVREYIPAATLKTFVREQTI